MKTDLNTNATGQWVPHLTPTFWSQTALNPDSYNTLVETGSYRGASLEFFRNKFQSIHSIELSRKWYEYCREKFRKDLHIVLHHGDSAKVLPQLMEGIRHPVIVFLDAHYSGGSTAKANENCDTPLLNELAYLKTRKYDDIIIVDDVSFFDVKGGSEPDTPPDDEVVWPQFAYDWSGITQEKVLALMKSEYRYLTNKTSQYTISPREDQLIFYPPAR
jgi:hypothetical protein